ncbi:MAG: hypothetical protein JW881_02550 [Spirochaetales bacterium]|nr:hypothetical protein [Spirochaetales bacterium]
MEKSSKMYAYFLWSALLLAVLLTGCPEIKNMRPEAAAEASPQTGQAGQYISLSAAGSRDPDGEITGYRWSFQETPSNSALGDNDIAGRNTVNAGFTADAAGLFVVLLEVTDEGGASDTQVLSVTITGGDPTLPPLQTATPVSTSVPTATPSSTAVSTATPLPVSTPVPTALPTATPVSAPASPSNLSVTANSPTSIRLNWTDNSSNETAFEIQREDPRISGSWVTVTQTAANSTYFSHNSLSETWPGYRIRAINDSGASAWTQVACAPPKLRIVNDLYNATGASGDWGRLNNIVRVRIASTESQVLNDSSNACERLCSYDSVSDISYADWIPPSYTSASSYEDFSVNTFTGIGTSYWVFIQCGWWEYDAALTYSWIKRVSNVLCANGSCCCYKWVTVSCTHYAGYLVIDASSFLPHGSWNGSL